MASLPEVLNLEDFAIFSNPSRKFVNLSHETVSRKEEKIYGIENEATGCYWSTRDSEVMTNVLTGVQL